MFWEKLFFCLCAGLGLASVYLQDQFINHIMNETGALVLVKGGSCETLSNEGINAIPFCYDIAKLNLFIHRNGYLLRSCMICYVLIMQIFLSRCTFSFQLTMPRV